MTFDDAVTRLAGQFDVATATVQSVLGERIRRFLGDSKWRAQEVSLGNTVAGTSVVALPPEVVHVEDLWIGTTPYDATDPHTIRELQAGRSSILDSRRGVFAESYDSSAARFLELFPTPDESGLAIMALEAVLATVTGATALPVPLDMEEYVLDGARASLLREVENDPGTAQAFEERYEVGIEKLRRRRNAMVGSGPRRIPVAGTDF